MSLLRTVLTNRNYSALPIGATGGKQTTKKWKHHHRISQLEKGLAVETQGINGSGMIGRTSEDDKEYECRAEEIEAWLKEYGQKYLGGVTADMSNESFHDSNWKYAILDDRPSAAKANTPLYERFVLTETSKGLTEDDAKKTIELLRSGPCR